MASPHISGAIALLWSGRPELRRNINATREILFKTAKHQQDASCGSGVAPNAVYGWGTVNVFKAFQHSKYYRRRRHHSRHNYKLSK